MGICNWLANALGCKVLTAGHDRVKDLCSVSVLPSQHLCTKAYWCLSCLHVYTTVCTKIIVHVKDPMPTF